jgi:predicted ferric reductase
MKEILLVGKFTGLSGAILLLVQLLLISWGKKTKLHKINGKIAFTFILVHVASMFYIYGLSVSKIDDVLEAFIALLLLILIIFTSVFIRNKLKYEIWYSIHLLTYLAVLLAFSHQKTPFPVFWKSLYIFTFANIFYFKFLKIVINFVRHKFKIEKIVQETSSTVSVYITGNNIDKFVYEPGQYVVIRFLDKNLFWQAHPFSFSSMPGNTYLRLTIKNSGDFTSQLVTCHLTLGTYVVLDGPHGNFITSQSKLNKMLLLAGGVGVTPLRALIEQFNILKKDVMMVYAIKNKDEILFAQELIKYKVKYVMGHLQKDNLKELVPDIASREVYICGPEGFNQSMKQYAREFGVKYTHLEEFST